MTKYKDVLVRFNKRKRKIQQLRLKNLVFLVKGNQIFIHIHLYLCQLMSLVIYNNMLQNQTFEEKKFSSKTMSAALKILLTRSQKIESSLSKEKKKKQQQRIQPTKKRMLLLLDQFFELDFYEQKLYFQQIIQDRIGEKMISQFHKELQQYIEGKQQELDERLQKRQKDEKQSEEIKKNKLLIQIGDQWLYKMKTYLLSKQTEALEKQQLSLLQKQRRIEDLEEQSLRYQKRIEDLEGQSRRYQKRKKYLEGKQKRELLMEENINQMQNPVEEIFRLFISIRIKCEVKENNCDYSQSFCTKCLACCCNCFSKLPGDLQKWQLVYKVVMLITGLLSFLGLFFSTQWVGDEFNVQDGMKATAVIFLIFFLIWMFLEFVLFAKVENKVKEIVEDVNECLKRFYENPKSKPMILSMIDKELQKLKIEMNYNSIQQENISNDITEQSLKNKIMKIHVYVEDPSNEIQEKESFKKKIQQWKNFLENLTGEQID